MWEVCRDKVVASGSDVRMERRVRRIEHADGEARTVVVDGPDGEERLRGDVGHLVDADLRAAASDGPAGAGRRRRPRPTPCGYRDFLTVALVVPESVAFPDNWIYVHEPDVKLGRIQNFGSWSPYMVQDGRTCLGLEYFVNEGDELWDLPDDRARRARQARAAADSAWSTRHWSRPATSSACRRPIRSTTPHYAGNVDVLRAWLEEHAANVHPVGRNGMHRYNNQDHSMYTAMLTVENILKGTSHDIWAVNVEQEYHEERAGDPSDDAGGAPGGSGTGRAAPVIA